MDAFVRPSISKGLGIVLLEAQCAVLSYIASTAVPKESNIAGIIDFVSLEKTSVDRCVALKKCWKMKNKTSKVDIVKNNKKSNYEIGKVAKQILEVTH